MKTLRGGVVVLCAGMAVSTHGAKALGADPLETCMTSIRLDELLAKGLTGAGINIGQVEFDRPRVTHEVFAGQSLTIYGDSPATIDTHETGVASLLIGKRTAAGGNFQGVATGASLYYSGFQNATVAPTLVERLRLAMNWQLTPTSPTVVNHSWGTTVAADAATRTTVGCIVDRAVTMGQTQVVAAGNDGLLAGSGGNNTGNIVWPGYGYNSITVGSLIGANYDRIRPTSSVSEFSGGAPTARLKIDLLAPGTDIKIASAVGNATFTNQSGTSFAAPITTGVVALLQQHGAKKGYSIDPRVMRAVLMNSANKTVMNRDGVRWDQEFKAGASATAANRTSNETGAGKLDAMEAYTQYDAGQQGATIKNQSATHNSFVDGTGWDVDTMTGKGDNNSSAYLTKEWMRKGTYLTTTLVWNREVDSTDADVTKWKYQDLAGMNLGISRSATLATKVSVSNFGEKAAGGEDDALKGTSQHNVYKIAERDQYWISATLRTTNPINTITYALAWRGYEMRVDRVEAFNGGFDGDRGAYRDNGWFKETNAITYGQAVREAWMPGNADNWAMRMVSGLGIQAGIAQEVVRPLTFFVVTFDIAFGAANFLSRVDVMLGNLFMGSVFADGTNTQSFQFISNFALDANQLAGLAPGSFVDLSFKFTSLDANSVFIDNVAYVPSAPAFALLGLAGVVAGRRRR